MAHRKDKHNLTERLRNGVVSLATSEKPIQKRLYYAADTIRHLQEREFPEHLQEAYRDIWINLKNEHTSDISEVTAAMPDKQASKVADQIVHLAIDFWLWLSRDIEVE